MAGGHVGGVGRRVWRCEAGDAVGGVCEWGKVCWGRERRGVEIEVGEEGDEEVM